MQVGEPSQEASLEILKGLREKYEKHHSLQITDEALEAAVSSPPGISTTGSCRTRPST